uniref:BTB domain-containing protein n=1 Tax=Panagrolaimus sp. PS1159 TaxID=55785 RepID=A0AC35FY41_9BILA
MPEIPFACKWTLTETELNRARNFDNVRLRTATNDVSVNNDPRFGYFFRLRTDNNEEARVCLCLDLRDVTEVKANFTFAITSANLSETINNHTFRNEHGHGIHLCTTDEFFRQGSNFIVDGKFTLSVNGIFKFNITGEPAAIEQINTCKPLSQRLWTATNQDFTIVVEEGNESTDYPIHQHVVGAHSTVFAEMFKLKNNEAVKDKITINDYSAKVFETALQMIYEIEFTFNLTFEEWMSLLKFFHRYQYQCYKDKVEEYCIQQIQASTVCRLTNLSILTNSPKLKEACLTFLDSAIVSKTYLSDYETLDLTLIAQIVLNSAVHTCETLNNA